MEPQACLVQVRALIHKTWLPPRIWSLQNPQTCGGVCGSGPLPWCRWHPVLEDTRPSSCQGQPVSCQVHDIFCLVGKTGNNENTGAVESKAGKSNSVLTEEGQRKCRDCSEQVWPRVGCVSWVEENDWPGKEERRDTTQKAQPGRDMVEALENGASRSCNQLSVSEA